MAGKMFVTRLYPLGGGLQDLPDPEDCPPQAFSTARGFHFKYGRPEAEDGRLLYSSTGEAVVVGPMVYWTRPDGLSKLYGTVNGGLNTIDDAGKTFIGKIEPGGTIRFANGSTSVVGTSTNFYHTVRAGDTIKVDAASAWRTVASVASHTVLHLTSASSEASSGAYTCRRTLSLGYESLLERDGRLIIADGSGPLHSYGQKQPGSPTYWFRELGMITPTTRPALSLGSGGALTAGAYFWQVAFEDDWEVCGNPIKTGTYTVTVGQACTLTNLPKAPVWARYFRIFRCAVGMDIGYHIVQDYDDLKVASISAPTKVITLASSQVQLKTNAHKYRRVEFAATEHQYFVTANTANTITVTSPNADGFAIGGESGTDTISLFGGFGIAEAEAGGSIVDVSPDTDLDDDFPAPEDNSPPPAGLTSLFACHGGRRIGGFDVTSQSKVYISGRPVSAWVRTGESPAADVDIDYWSPDNEFPVGIEDGDLIQKVISLSGRAFALKQNSLWELVDVGDDCTYWAWEKIADVGCFAKGTVVVHEGTAYWLGHRGQELDLIRFNGGAVIPFGRKVLRRCLDTIKKSSPTLPQGGIHQGVYYMSYPTTAASQNCDTLRYDILRRTFDIQPWGCGPMANSVMISGVPTMYAAYPAATGRVVKVLGSAQDMAGNISRELVFGGVSPPEIGAKALWDVVEIEVELG
jgi:hypothetical protein